MKTVAVKTIETLFNQANKDRYVDVVIGQIDGKDITMSVKKWLTLKEYFQFEMDMQGAEYDVEGDDKKKENFSAASYNIKFVFALVRHYTNIKLSQDINEAYETIYALELVEKIMDVIEYTPQYVALLEAINSSKDEYKRMVNAESKVADVMQVQEMLESLKDTWVMQDNEPDNNVIELPDQKGD